MDVTVEVGGADGFSSDPASVNPAREAARAEVEKMMTDPTHKHYEGFKRNDAATNAYLNDLYSKAGAEAAPSQRRDSVSLGPAEALEGETPEEAEVRQRNEVILAPLKQEWGADFDSRFAQARATACTLFENRTEMLEELGTIVRMQYGPKGEAAALKFFAELEAIKHGG